MEYKLNDNLCLKYIECVKIDAVNYYKYVVNNLKAKSSDSKEIYFNRQIDLKNIDKDKLSNYITKNILSADENLVVNLDDFMLNKPTKEKEKSGGSSSDGGNASRKSNKNNTGSMGFELLNLNKFDEAHNLINGANECGNIMMALINLSGHESLNGQNSGIADSITGFKSKIKGLAGGNGPTAFFCEYKSVYNDLRDGINIAVATQMLLLEENGYLKQSEESLAMFGNEAFSKEFRELMNGVVNGEITFNNTAELNDAIASLQSKYSVVTEDDAKMILGAASLTEDSEKLKNMSPEEREKFIKNKNEQLDSIYNHLNETIGITRDAFDNMLKNNLDELAKMISDASIKSAENVKAGGEGINIMNDLIYSIQDSWYSTSAGQEALLDRFKDESITGFDEYDALANTEYIKYCIMTGHTQDWLKDDFRKFANVVAKLDATGNFSTVTDNLSEEELDYVNSYVDATGFIPYGYVKVKKDGKDVYKRRDYTKQGQEMLYYMDYHCGEDVAKEDDKKIITAFSERGKFDAYERNYKGGWINDRITGNYSNESEKQKAIENAERDYNILNGIIDDPDRKQELIDEGCISFEQLSSFINNDSVDLSQLANKDYIDENKEEIMAATGLSESQLYNFTITGSLPPTGSVYIDSKIQASVVAGATLYISTIQGLTGVAKFFENVGDAAKTAVNNDFFLNIGTTKDPIYGTTHYNDFSQNIEFAKEFKEYRENIWSKYLSDNDRYKKDFDEFSKEISDDQLKQFIAGILGPTVSQYSLITSDSYSLSDADRQKYLPKMFEEIKMQEWSLNDSSSSNYYLATFKEGIRNGGDFSSFDNLDTYIVENATKQFEVINEVSVQKVDDFVRENIYDKDWYDTVESFSVVKHDNILGMTANQIGNMAIPVALNLVPGVGQALSSITLFTSAFGGAAEEAFVSGASYNEALGYATLSATTELAIEKIFSGVAGFGQGWMDDALDYIPNRLIDSIDNLIFNRTGSVDVLRNNVFTQTAKSLITGGIGEGIEEVVTDFITPLWQSLTYMNEKSYIDIRNENVSLESLTQTFLVSFLSSMVFGSTEIVQKTNHYNNQIQTIVNEIGEIPGFREQTNNILAEMIGYDSGYLTTEVITRIIENNAKKIELNSENTTALKELQQKLSDAYQKLTENNIEIETPNGITNVSRELIMNIGEITGLNKKGFLNREPSITIEDSKLKFKDTKSQEKFINAVYDNAINIVNNTIRQNNQYIEQYQASLDANRIKLDNLVSAIQTLKELGQNSNFSDVLGSIVLEINETEVTIPISIANTITTKYDIKDGKIVFTEENMSANEFATKVISLATQTLYMKNIQHLLEIEAFKNAASTGDMKLLEEASNIIGNNINTFVVNSSKVDGQDLIKLEVKTNINGEYRNVNIYVDSSTSPTVYLYNELLTEKIQEVINENIGKENIYLGEITYDKTNNEMIITKNQQNNLFVENIKTTMQNENLSMYTYEYVDGNIKRKFNIYVDNQTDVNIFENNNVNKKINEIISEKIKTNPDIKDIYIGKIELKNGQANITTDRAQDAFVESKRENIVTTERTNVSGTNLIKVETYVTINGKTEKVNVYLDSKSNTNLLSNKNPNNKMVKEKILDLIIKEKESNKNAQDVYIGEVLNDKKSGTVVVNKNNTTLEQFRATILSSALLSNPTNTSNVNNRKNNTKTNQENNKKNTKANTEVVSEKVVVDTKSIVNSSIVKPQIDMFIQDVETKLKEFVATHKNDPDFNMKLEQKKVQTNIEFNEIILELKGKINASYNEVIEQIKQKIETLNENDPQVVKLKSEMDALIKEREAEIQKLTQYDTSKLNQIFNSILTKNVQETSEIFEAMKESELIEERNSTFNEQNTQENVNTVVEQEQKPDLIFYHGGVDSTFTLDQLDVLRRAQKQQKRNSSYAGFYMYSEQDRDGSFHYAQQQNQQNNTSSRGVMKIIMDGDVKVYQVPPFSITRLTQEQLIELQKQGYDLVAGKMMGKTEYVLLNKDKIKEMSFESMDMRYVETNESSTSENVNNSNESSTETTTKVKSNSNHTNTNTVLNIESDRNKINEQIVDVIYVERNSKSKYSIGFGRQKFDMNKTYQKYDYVVKPKTDLISAIKEAKRHLNGNILIEISNTLELTQEVIDELSDNISVRITGGYTLDFLNAKLKSPQITGTASLEHTTYSKTELQSILNIINVIDSQINPNWSQSEIAEFLYNYLKNNIVYNPNPIGGNANRAKRFDGLLSLVEAESTCQGFAYTYNSLLARYGIKSYVISGSLEGVGQHVFNVVEIDGNKFIVDTTREILGSDKYTGTGFNPNNIYEYEFSSYEEIQQSMYMDSLNNILQNPDLLSDVINNKNYRGIPVEMILEGLKLLEQLPLEVNNKLKEILNTLKNDQNADETVIKEIEEIILKDKSNSEANNQSMFTENSTIEEAREKNSNLSQNPEIATSNAMDTFDIPKEQEITDESISDISTGNNVMPKAFKVNSIDILSRENITIEVDTKLLEELVQDSDKLTHKLNGLFNFKLPPKAIKDGLIKYIDFAKENNISIQIDKNVQKWYDAVKEAKENNHILINEDEVIRKGVEPKTRLIYEFDSVKYNMFFAEIKIAELLDMIVGKAKITLTPSQFNYALNELSYYIKENDIKLDEKTTNILQQIRDVERNKIVINPIEVINGDSPIMINKYIKVDGRSVNTLQLVELISNKMDLVSLMNNRVYIDGLQNINIESAVIELFNISPELSIQYNEVLDLIKEVKNSTVLFDAKNNTYALLPKEINGINTETILELKSESIETLNRIINNLDVEILNKYKSVIDEIINIVNEKNIQIDVSDLINLKDKLEVPETKHRDVFGILHKAYSLNQEIGGTYGPEQSAVGIKLSKIQLKSSIETLFKTKMTDIEFFNHLGLDSVTQEKFKKILDKNYRKQNGIFAKMFGNYVNNEVVYQELQKLAEIVKNNIPGLGNKQAFMFLYYLEAGEIGANGICSYADAASIIINEYLGDPIRFEQDFGFPMYTVNSEGNRIYNYEMLIVDMYSTINKDTLLTIDEKTGHTIFEATNEKQTYLGDFGVGLNEDALNKYFKDKNIELSLNKTFDFNSNKDAMHYEKVLEVIAKELQKGNTVHLGASGFALYDEQGQNVADDVGGHAMTVLGINSDGNLVVNSWGKIAIFDLKAELAKAGLEYSKTDANGEIIKKGISTLDIEIIETKDGISDFEGVIELTKNSNRSSVQGNVDANETNLGNKGTKDFKNSIVDNVKQTINEQELIIIESNNIVDANGVVNFEKLKLEISKVTEYIRNVSKNFFKQKYSNNSIINGVSYYNKFRSEQYMYYNKEIGKVIKTVLEKASEIGNEISKLNLELQELESNDTDLERINELLSNYRKSKIDDAKKIIKNKIKNLETNKGRLLLQVEKVYEIANSEFTNAILKPVYDKYYGVYEKIASRYDTSNGMLMNSARYKLQLRNLHRNLVSHYGEVDAAYFIEEIGNEYIRQHSIKFTGNNFELSNMLERLDKNIISQEKIDVLSTIIQELNLKLRENNIIIRIQDNLIGNDSIDNLILNLQSIKNALDTVKNVNEMLVNKSNAVIPNEIVIANTISPSNYVSQYYSNSTREVNLNAKTDNMKTIHIYDSIVTEEKIVHQYAHLLAKNIIANNPSFVKEWIIAMTNDTKYVSNYAQVSIIEDIVETITKSIMYPIGPRECDSRYSYRFALIRGTNKLPNSGIFENANKKYNSYIRGKRGTFVYEDVYEDISISDKKKYNLRNNIEILQFNDKVIEDYDYKDYVKHLIFEGEIFEDGIYGAHNMKYFNELVRNSKDLEGNARIKIIEKIKHPIIDGLYSIKYSVDGEEIVNPKTIYDPTKISDNLILEFANEAIDNRILIDDGQRRNYIGISSNGMLFQMHYSNNNLMSIYPVFEPIEIPKSLIVPVKAKMDIFYVPVNIDSSTETKTFMYGKALINRVQKEFMKLPEVTMNESLPPFPLTKKDLLNGTASLDLGKIEYNSRTGEIETEVLEKFDVPNESESDESIIIDASDELKKFGNSVQETKNVQIKASRPQIQAENIKQLSIMDNIKHTLQRINDKFTGYKTSKLKTESYYDRTTKSNNKLFKQKQINKTFRDFANRHLIDLENLINNGLLRNPKISEINSLITNNRVLSNMEDGNVSIADILGTKKNIDLDKNFGLLFDESASEFQTRDLGLLEYTSDQILGVLSESFKNHPLVISEVDTGKYIIEDNGYHRYSILRLHYLNEYIKVKDNPELVRELNEKYKVPVKVYKLDTTKTYSTSILKALGMNVEVRTKGFKKTSNIFIDGKKVIMSDTELIEFTKNMINSNTNSTQVINRLLSESETFKEFYNEYLVDELLDDGINIDETSSLILESLSYTDIASARSDVISTKPYTPSKEQIADVINKYGSYSVNMFTQILKDSNKLKEFIKNNNSRHIEKIQGVINELYPNNVFNNRVIKLKTIINSLDGRTVLNIDDVVDNFSKPILVDNSVIEKFNELNLNNNISVETLYKFVLDSNGIFNLLDGKSYNGIEINEISKSLSELLQVAKNNRYTDNVINEIESVLKVLNSDLSLNAKYDSISEIHVEANTPKGYYVFENLFKKEKSTRRVVKLLEEKGYKTEEISEIILHRALRMENNLISKAYYYRAFNYLTQNKYDEKYAATLISQMYQNILDLRGTRVIGNVSGVEIKIVNNYKGKNELLTLENVSKKLEEAKKYYFKTGLNEIIIYDSFSPRNIFCEKVQYSDFVNKYGTRVISEASATDNRIDLWEDFKNIDTIIHEYAHTIERDITKRSGYYTLFTNTSEWINAINKDKRITQEPVTEYATASNQEDFAEFIKEFNRNPLKTAIKYPNRYKVASKYLNMEIDSAIIQSYLDSTYLFDVVEKLSCILTEEGTTLGFVKQYLFGNTTAFNNTAKIVVEELNSIYETKIEILEDFDIFEALEQIRLSEKMSSTEFLDLINNYINGNDISSNIKELNNLKIIEMYQKEDIDYWYEEKINEDEGELELLTETNSESINSSMPIYEAYESIVDLFKKPSGDLELFKDALSNNKLNTLSDSEIKSLIENINKGKIKPKDYVLSAETIRILIDKVPLKKIFPLSNVTAIKSFIDYFGVDTLIEFDRLNNGFLFGNKGENLYNLFDFYDLSIPKTNVVDKMKELNKLIVDTINSNKKTEHKTYTFIYSELIGTEFAKIHPELFLDESAPEDLKIAFYNGLVNSSNEYKPEWAPYLEGKSVKGVIHEALVSYSEIDAVENINIIGETSSKYNEGLEELATRTGMSVEEVQEILGIKLKELIDTSEFGVRRTLKSLEAILKSGKIKNQFEVNHTSYGVNSTDMRMAMEKDLFGIPRNMKYEDRPIYGMLLPGDLTSKYVQKGPGAYYSDGDGVIYIFNKDKIMKNTTLTLGDSIDQASKICATNLSNPKYFGMFSEMLSTIKTKEDLLSFDFRSLYEKKVMEVGNSAYYEFQLHGESSHTLDNLKEIVFLKMPEARIIKKLNEKNIKWRVLTKEGLITGAPEQKTTEVIVDVNDKSKYFSFSKDLDKSNNQLSVYFGDAGRDVNMLFLNGKTINQILDELQGTKKIDFQKFLNYTIQGQYLSRLTHEEIEALLLYTRYFFEDVNTMLREKNIYGSIDGKNAQALIDTIDSAIEKYNGLEQAMEVYRFVDINAFTHKGSAYKVLFDGIDLSDLNQVYSVLKVLEGKEISDLGYMSTSPKYVTSFSVSENYPIVLDIIAHKGTECAYINQISKYYNIENEILFARNTTLKIVEVLKPQEDTSGLKKIVIKCIVKEKE